MSSAVKISDELVRAARNECGIQSRSMTQQIEHWARIGRALERSPAISHERIRAALQAELAFDELNSEEQAVALGQLEKDILRPRGDAEFAERLREAERPLSGIDAQGRLVAVHADGRPAPIDDLRAYVAAQKRRQQRGVRRPG